MNNLNQKNNKEIGLAASMVNILLASLVVIMLASCGDDLSHSGGTKFGGTDESDNMNTLPHPDFNAGAQASNTEATASNIESETSNSGFGLIPATNFIASNANEFILAGQCLP